MAPFTYALAFALTLAYVGASVVYINVYPSKICPPITFDGQLTCNLFKNEQYQGLPGERQTKDTKTDTDVRQIKSIQVTRNGRPIAHVSTYKPAEPLVDEPNMKVNGDLQQGYLTLVWDAPNQDQVGSYACEIDAIDEDGKDYHFSKRDFTSWCQPGLDEVIYEMNKIHSQLDSRPVPRTQNGRGKCGKSSSWTSDPDNSRANARVATVEGQFENVFFDTPVFAVFFDGADAQAPLRFELNVKEVSNLGYKVECITWGGSQIDELEFTWTALTPPKEGVVYF